MIKLKTAAKSEMRKKYKERKVQLREEGKHATNIVSAAVSEDVDVELTLCEAEEV